MADIDSLVEIDLPAPPTLKKVSFAEDPIEEEPEQPADEDSFEMDTSDD